MPPRLLWLSLLPLLALQPALSQAAGASPPFFDEDMSAQLREAGELARKATEDLLRSFELLRDAIPRYGVPYLDEHGNIIIPRHPRPAAPGAGTRTAA
jgi:hypothetical protein